VTNTRDCYTNLGESADCVGAPSNGLNLLEVVGARPFAFELTRRKTLFEQPGSKTNHDHSAIADGKTQSEPPRSEAPKSDASIPEAPKSQAPKDEGQKPEAFSSEPKPETPHSGPKPGAPLSEPEPEGPHSEAQSGLPQLEFEFNADQSSQNRKPALNSPPVLNSQTFTRSRPERYPPGLHPRQFPPGVFDELEQLPAWPEQPKPSEKRVDDLVALLPDHPIRGVTKSLLKGLLTGEINRQEVASAMEQFARAYNGKDITNLPPVNSDDFPLGDASETSLRLRKASIAFNNVLAKLDLKMEVTDDKGIVIYSRKSPPVSIGVKLTGEINAFRHSNPVRLQDAVAELKPLLAKL
jgi:hypothetical protein